MKNMGCCGKVNKAKNIAFGSLSVVLDKINLLPSNAFTYHSFRTKACQGCQRRTYLTDAEYLEWVKENGGLEKFVAEIDRLEDWPLLPIKHDECQGAKLFCSLCKCWTKAKAYVKAENCPVAHPDWRKPKCFFKDSKNG